MSSRLTAKIPRVRMRQRSARLTATLVAGAAGLTLAGLVGMAAAQSPSTLGTATNSALGETIVVDSHGLTVYELTPEITHNLLCTKANGCFHIWRPVTVGSAKTKLRTAQGVTAKIGMLHRNGFFQLTLGGHPLYHFVGDKSQQGAAVGQGIHSFRGTWHVVTASSGTTPTTTTPTTTTPTMTTPTTTPTTPTTPYYLIPGLY